MIQAEWLDEMPAEEPRAVRSRADLRRLNWFMNHAGILARELSFIAKPGRALDLGGGDGAFALRLLQTTNWRRCEFVVVDRNPILSPKVQDGFKALECSVTPLRCDVLDGLESAGAADIIFANLFLHHFQPPALKRLLSNVATRTRIFLACEPRRSPLALAASRCVALLGCNAVTRHDAVISVRAGFHGQDLSRLWPVADGWNVDERAAGLFSHLFVARKR
ncbi:MAG TPA: methyltransferase domain-containing protein [Verrucomicrobiae bacterium]